MLSMLLTHINKPLTLTNVPIPTPNSNQVLLKVAACAVCRTDLHVYDGDLTAPKLPLILGHEIVGEVVQLGTNVSQFKLGDRLGVPWLGSTCGNCSFCKQHQENLCDAAKFTGYTLNGGFAEYTVADANFCFPIPENYSSINAAPLLCAGLIGYRCYKFTGSNCQHLGIYGFGAAAHILCQIAKFQGKQVYAFTKPGDAAAQQFALQLGAVWAGSADAAPPHKLDAAIIFAPVGNLVPTALSNTRKGGIVVCGGIHMSDIPRFPYSLLWGERKLVSVANLTRSDGLEFLKIASQTPFSTTVTTYSLEQANQALSDLRAGKVHGAAVIQF